MQVKIERLMKDIETIGGFTETPEEGCTRFSYSKEDKQARDYIINEMKKIGLQVTVDPIGNIRGRLEGENKDQSIIMSGSHIDTVYKGGKYDGVLGVAGALEVARVLVENNVSLKRPYEVIVFTEEEGSNFGSNLLGSKALTGNCTVEQLKELKDKNGESMYEKIEKLDLNPENLQKCVLNPSEIKGMVELHIEQASVLDKENKTVGIVSGIAGLIWLEIEIQGEANHAGATPMYLRKDAMVAASHLIANIPQIVKEKGDNTTVATVGEISCTPNAINVISERVRFTIDLRGMGWDTLKLIVQEMDDRLKELEKDGFKCNMKVLTEAREIRLSEKISNIIEESAKEEKISYKRMYSGANHDSSIMSQITDVAMIFVPSVKGRSHCPEEYTRQEDIEEGCQLLLKTIMKLIAS